MVDSSNSSTPSIASFWTSGAESPEPELDASIGAEEVDDFTTHSDLDEAPLLQKRYFTFRMNTLKGFPKTRCLLIGHLVNLNET